MLFILAMDPLQRLFQLATLRGFLTPINNRTATMRVSLYADDAAVFVNPSKDDIFTVASILHLFGAVSGLVTNRSKCAVFPIQCDGFDLHEMMEGFPCPVASFPCTYLGLPLHIRQPKRVDFQPLIDKMAAKLPAWKGKFLNRAGRLKLLNASLSSIPTYFLTVFAPKKWFLKRINKIRRGFLWKGSEDVNGGHCLVNWRKVQMPKKLGGLGVHELEYFSRALRLRWLWYQWHEVDRLWVASDVPCNDIDRQLFRLSTVVILGNGVKARFWDSPWLQGRAPRDIAPRLYKLAWRKNLSVAEELQDANWMRGLWRMDSAVQIAELIHLWPLIQDVQLNQQQEDALIWRWTSTGCYTAKSAYEVQFRGSYSALNCSAIWKARTEGKHRFFAWLLLQSKLLTADNLLARNWPCNPLCPLCDQDLETPQHISLHCVFAQQVWLQVSWWTFGRVQPPAIGSSLTDWWNSSMQTTPKELKRNLAAVLIYTAWNLWKERNRRIFDHTAATPMRVMALIKEEIKLRHLACGGGVLPHRGF
jgi:hypothetical protein